MALQLRSANDRRVHVALAHVIDVCLIYRSVFGLRSVRVYGLCLGLREEMVERLFVEKRYRGWQRGLEARALDRRRE